MSIRLSSGNGLDDVTVEVRESARDEIALLDRSGTIVHVNDAWRAFCRDNGGDDAACGVGASYVSVCEAAAGDSATDAVAAAIRSAVRGEVLTPLQVAIPCHAPTQERWFDIFVSSRLRDDGRCVGAAVVLRPSARYGGGRAAGARAPQQQDDEATPSRDPSPAVRAHLLRLALDLQVDALLFSLGSRAAVSQCVCGRRSDAGATCVIPWQRWLTQDVEATTALAGHLIAEGTELPAELAGAAQSAEAAVAALDARYREIVALLADAGAVDGVCGLYERRLHELAALGANRIKAVRTGR